MSPNDNKKSNKNKNENDINDFAQRRILHHTKILESKESHDSYDDLNTTKHGFHTSNDNKKAS